MPRFVKGKHGCGYTLSAFMNQIPLVAIIDDDHTFQFITRTLIERSRKVRSIVQFRDGEEAFEYFVRYKDEPDKVPDLVFVDLHMPYLNGWQLLSKLIAHGLEKQVNTIFICSSSEKSTDLDKFKTFPLLEGYLVKPIKKDDIDRLLDAKLQSLEA